VLQFTGKYDRSHKDREKKLKTTKGNDPNQHKVLEKMSPEILARLWVCFRIKSVLLWYACSLAWPVAYRCLFPLTGRPGLNGQHFGSHPRARHLHTTQRTPVLEN
jgi:hypothetical protein